MRKNNLSSVGGIKDIGPTLDVVFHYVLSVLLGLGGELLSELGLGLLQREDPDLVRFLPLLAGLCSAKASLAPAEDLGLLVDGASSLAVILLLGEVVLQLIVLGTLLDLTDILRYVHKCLGHLPDFMQV